MRDSDESTADERAVMHDGAMAETGVADRGSLEPFLLAVVATGAPMVGGPTALQVLWLIAVAVAAFMGRRTLRDEPAQWG